MNFSLSLTMRKDIEAAAAVIKSGGLVVFPTRGLYGIGGDALNPEAVTQVFALKGRPAAKPILALISDQDMLTMLVRYVSPMAAYLMQCFWPGKVTFVLDALAGLPAGLCSDTGKIGVRWVGHPMAAALVTAAGRPITGTSANLSGEKGCAAVKDISETVLESVSRVLDAGVLAGGPGSTVVDVTGDTPLILRQGAVSRSEIMEAFKRV